MSPLDLATAIRAHVDYLRRHRDDGGRALDALDALAEELAPVAGPLKRCSCGASYDAAAWSALPLVGIQDDGIERIALRNCTAAHPQRGRCMSTLGVVVGPTAELPVAPPPADPGAPPAEGSSEAYVRPTANDRADNHHTDTPAGPPACEGCNGPLTAEQIRKGARACQPSCRAKAHRARERAKRLAALDAAAAALAEARAEIAGPEGTPQP